MSAGTCVVCGAPVGEAQFANAWEKARKVMACCSTGCAGRFDPDVHWIPSVAPVADKDEQRRLLKLAVERINNGDAPSVVVRESLVAGVPPHDLRFALRQAAAAAKASDKAAIKRGVFFSVLGALAGRWSVTKNADPRDAELLNGADADIATWQQRWG